MHSRSIVRVVTPVAIAATMVASMPAAMAQQPRPARPRDTFSSAARPTIPQDTVVRVRLEDSLDSRKSRVGDRFTASLAPNDRSGFPLGTKFEGTVSEVQKSDDDHPGVIDMRINRAILPDGRAVPLNGRLASLSSEDVRTNKNGRMRARHRDSGGSGFDLKWVGYGAAGGAVLGAIFGGNLLKGALLGGLGGAIYGYLNRDKGGRDDFHDVSLDRGQEFGVRLADNVSFDSRNTYRYENTVLDRDDRDRVGGRGNDRVLGTRDEYRYGRTNVFVNGRAVTFADARPISLNGDLYLPLAPVAQAANLRFDYRAGDDFFSLRGPSGTVEATTGEMTVDMPGSRTERLTSAPISIDGEIYVPVEFLNRVADMRANWDRRAMRLDLDSYNRATR